MNEINNRRVQTSERLELLHEQLHTQAAHLVKGKACVYVTGSFGRGEAGKYSDLDIFILGKIDNKDNGEGLPLLGNLDEICLKAELIDITRRNSIPDFSGEGRYLTHHSTIDLVSTLGTPKDDESNTFTARLLLMLESKPLLEDAVYERAVEDVIAAYWRDYEDHKADFMPAFLANDILRLWRTFCVNYEARTKNISLAERTKRKLKNYKLKHSRLLTCYSALLYMLFIYVQKKTVSPRDAVSMTGMTPTERLEWLRDEPAAKRAKGAITALLEQYDMFLKVTNAEEKELLERFSDKQPSAAYLDEAYGFGDAIFNALKAIGEGDRFFRLLVV